MKLIIEDDNGKQVEVNRTASIGDGDVILFSDMVIPPKQIESIEVEMSSKIGRKVILLDGRFKEILIIPP